ncbi:MAG TPA: YihY/virulence factor BrkB family protein [Candidatus Pseudogracilibacillus intestinigallinarum]|uniref:YihY/virulence factor BrkB family protein n=1 Tax=Candidatus Pseudogracilibacillus intestinigallinarum TaxID=2838742 RepID=A0A9D1PN47_9BACI|nr:YihY/virulence factor BrkB family protein [Candidatus Pseudogracilibacillus intestinigallinarum]
MQKIIRFSKEMTRRIGEADVMGLSAQLAYFFLLSLFPFLLFLVTLLGFLPIQVDEFLDSIGTYLPEEVVVMIESNLTNLVNTRSGGLLSVSILGTIWSASNAFNAIAKSFNKAYQIEEERSFIKNRLVAFVLMFVLIIVVAVALLLSVFGKLIGEKLFGLIGLHSLADIWDLVRLSASSLTFFVAFVILYKFAPNRKIKVTYVVWGALFTTILWQIASLGFSFYVNTLGNYSATYGSLGTVIILMIWFYLSGIIINTGGVLNAYILDMKENKYEVK